MVEERVQPRPSTNVASRKRNLKEVDDGEEKAEGRDRCREERWQSPSGDGMVMGKERTGCS